MLDRRILNKLEDSNKNNFSKAKIFQFGTRMTEFEKPTADESNKTGQNLKWMRILIAFELQTYSAKSTYPVSH